MAVLSSKFAWGSLSVRMKRTNWYSKYKILSEARKAARAARRALSKVPEDSVSDEPVIKARRTLEELSLRLGKPQPKHSELERLTARLLVQLREAGLRKEKGIVRQYAESIGWAVAIALLIRIFLFEPFKIPTGSMIPTLQIGDHIFVSKSSYGLKLPFSSSYLFRWGDPERGDIVVFPFPVKGHQDYGKDFIKRVIGLPGDHVQLRSNVLYINGEPVDTHREEELADCGGSDGRPCADCVRHVEKLGERTYTTQHCPPGGITPDWPRGSGPSASIPVFEVPEGHVFVMGDNRDNSSDGRFWTSDPLDQYTPVYAPNSQVQTVPVRLIRGKAVIVWWAQDKSRLFSIIE